LQISTKKFQWLGQKKKHFPVGYMAYIALHFTVLNFAGGNVYALNRFFFADFLQQQ